MVANSKSHLQTSIKVVQTPKQIKKHKTGSGNLLNQDGNTDAQPVLQQTLTTHWLQTSLDILAKIHLLASYSQLADKCYAN